MSSRLEGKQCSFEMNAIKCTAFQQSPLIHLENQLISYLEVTVEAPFLAVPATLAIGIPKGKFQDLRRSDKVDLNLAHRIAIRCIALAPELTRGSSVEALDIVRHSVGLRPSRVGGARLELERIGAGLVVHNYGMTLPWKS